MAESHPARPVVLHSSVGDFELQETVHYPNGGSSYFYACVDVAAIVDEGICEAGNPDQVFDYSLITNKQNEYIASYDHVYRFLAEDTDRLEWCLEAQNGELDAFKPRQNSDRANLAEVSPLERDFEEHFAEVYGPDSVRCLWREYGIVDLNGSTRYLDYLVKTDSGDIAVEVNGVTYHHPQRIGPEKYRNQLLKQNFDAYARRIVGWNVSRRMNTALVLDALEMALWQRNPDGELIHHNDAGVQYLSIAYSERLEEAGIAASVGSVGDAYDNALAETINGLYKAEVIRHMGPWKGFDDVEYSTLEWVDWYNKERLFGTIGYVPPAELEAKYWEKEFMQVA